MDLSTMSIGDATYWQEVDAFLALLPEVEPTGFPILALLDEVKKTLVSWFLTTSRSHVQYQCENSGHTQTITNPHPAQKRFVANPYLVHRR